ncbi:MAG TPA: nuclear transport factor 2 family protein [Polyangiaceae bacterium]|nr:nuclear transport factor 2 family protein [Polyangiaceae bacterium]
MENIVERYLQIWNTTDSSARRAAIEALFTRDCRYTDPIASVSGPAELDTFIAGLQKQFSGVTFKLASRVDAHHDLARFSWHATAAHSAEPLAIGFDVVSLNQGRIERVLGFLDKAPG